MPNNTAYTVVLRSTSHDSPDSTIARQIRAANGEQALSEALALAARLSQDRGREYRVARVDPT